MPQCEWCSVRRAALRRPKTGASICKECFFEQFETEIHTTITVNGLFRAGQKVAVAASGGKDSTVLAHTLSLLNKRYGYGLELFLLSVDEGITGYRDDSLEVWSTACSAVPIPIGCTCVLT
jgi:cytoplasmic tRNA 2-thiolation protein 1